MRPIAVVAALAAATFSLTPAAAAHQGNPNMRSVVRALQPQTPGVRVTVLGGDDRFLLVNHSHKDVVVYGYQDDPYARVLADGRVQVNERSPAYYLNQDRSSAVAVPVTANPDAPPRWTTVDETGRFQWHDHRMHYMGSGVPSQVTDRSRYQEVFRYRIPLKVGGRRGTIAGSLDWVPTPGGGPPTAALAALVALVVLSGGAAILVRRRRSGENTATAGAW